MSLLIDTDAFCKLGIAGLIPEVPALFNTDLKACRRLSALPYMLQRGRLRRSFGAGACEALIPLAESVLAVVNPATLWIDLLARCQAVDPGEALLFAAAAETGSYVLTGDKRALRGAKGVHGFAEAVSGRIASLDAVLFALCGRIGTEEVRRRLAPVIASDVALQVAFSSGVPDPTEPLLSYFQDLAGELLPLVLWDPRATGGL